MTDTPPAPPISPKHDDEDWASPATEQGKNTYGDGGRTLGPRMSFNEPDRD